MPVLKLRPACKDYLWGGERLRTDFNIESDLSPLAEAWVLSCHPDGPSVIENGSFAGQTLAQYIAVHPESVGSLGAAFADFPVLIKLIDAKGDLSIQVHPSDEYALKHENQFGKTEMWYILDCAPDAYLYYGFEHEIDSAEFASRIQDNTLPQVLHRAPVHKGDLFFIPAGTLHAICKGIVLAEVQQNSNVTYRIYDYGRLGPDGQPRALHIQQARAVTETKPVDTTKFDFDGHLAQCRYFTVDILQAPLTATVGTESFAALLAVDGTGSISCDGDTVHLRKGGCVFLPAGSGDYQVEGTLSLLCTSAGNA